jgi:hypothetical protein
VRLAHALAFAFAFALTLPTVARGDISPSLPSKGRPLDLSQAAAHDARFKRWVKSRGGRLSRWGWAQLDDDPAPERFAYVCKSEEDDGGMWLLIEDDNGKRWSIERDTDGRTSCQIDE